MTNEQKPDMSALKADIEKTKMQDERLRRTKGNPFDYQCRDCGVEWFGSYPPICDKTREPCRPSERDELDEPIGRYDDVDALLEAVREGYICSEHNTIEWELEFESARQRLLDWRDAEVRKAIAEYDHAPTCPTRRCAGPSTVVFGELCGETMGHPFHAESHVYPERAVHHFEPGKCTLPCPKARYQ